MPYLYRYKNRSTRVGYAGYTRAVLVFVLLFFIAGAFVFRAVTSHANSLRSTIKSGYKGYCLDDYQSQTAPGSKVDLYNCNNTAAQSWKVSYDTIEQSNNNCLTVVANGTSVGSQIILDTCTGDPGQVWLRGATGFINPNSGFCLAASGAKNGSSLALGNCTSDAVNSVSWTPVGPNGNPINPNCSVLSGGQKVACYAASEWATWQSGSVNHNDLLNKYSAGNAYEQWCADFVSYVYKESGSPFSGGERNGWDEYDANNIQNMGFSVHSESNYQPKPGDIAFFAYSGGHVEVVLSGGKNPTFVYGDSGTTDPVTGNGNMAANTIVTNGSNGQLVYYLTPN